VGTLPTPARTGFTFGGWYTAQNGGGSQFTASTPVTATITVYAKWTTDPAPSDLFLEDALAWITANAVEGGEYTIVVKRDETIPPKTLSYNGKNVSITLIGDTTERTVNLSTNGSLFIVGDQVHLTLAGKLTLRGRSGNARPLVQVASGGTLGMQTGSKITGNSFSAYSSGYGEISGNPDFAGRGGGVYVYNGTFTMSGGEISGNSVSSGGGVYLSSGTFTMSGGEISGNTAFDDYPGYGGGGVYVIDGTFTMSGGEISGNTTGRGGGVYLSSGTFTMSGGTISGNTTGYGGGGVLVSDGTFAMSGGTISGNTTGYDGGGVSVDRGTFTKQGGGTIYGSDASSILKNTTRDDGQAVFYYGNSFSFKKRNTTAGPGVNMDSTKDGSAGGWEWE
jgi:uncharacterized repeat protein (TIGR02543 family)